MRLGQCPSIWSFFFLKASLTSKDSMNVFFFNLKIKSFQAWFMMTYHVYVMDCLGHNKVMSKIISS